MLFIGVAVCVVSPSDGNSSASVSSVGEAVSQPEQQIPHPTCESDSRDFIHFLTLSGYPVLGGVGMEGGRGMPRPAKAPSALVSVACAPIIEARAVVWLSGPPAAGKTTLANRSKAYGFVGISGDLWQPRFSVPHASRIFNDRSDSLIAATALGFRDSPTAIVMDAEHNRYLARAPPNVLRVMLLPEREVYYARWAERNESYWEASKHLDMQPYTSKYSEALNMWHRDGGTTMIRVQDQGGNGCPDAALIDMCNGIMDFWEKSEPVLCFYCNRSSPGSTFRRRTHIRCPGCSP